ncbi:MAG TPA: hypothetical protein ENN84_11025 [Candidatus Marinimicrobia bacterium]|nr:hypothetical protein [Candidatus Neomarinimicrobiota bacterium]
MKKMMVSLMLMGFVLAGCSATGSVATFNPDWDRTQIYKYLDENANVMLYDDYVVALGEPEAVEEANNMITAVWVKSNSNKKYKLSLTFNAESKNCRGYSYSLIQNS